MRFLAWLPKNYMSWAIGHLARLPLPRPLARLSVSLFAQAYSIDHSEATRPIDTYRSVGDFFTRDLKPELRPISDGVVCPVDGTLRLCSDISAERKIVQVKGKTYSLDALLGSRSLAERFETGQLWNFYLSPQDAHHIHSPVDGRIVRTIHIPGKLWPVNDWALHSVDGLFAVNERVVSVIESAVGCVAVVMVGATNVGRIKLSYTDVVTNRTPWMPKKLGTIEHSEPIMVKRGEKIGTFMMGSSVLLATESKLVDASLVPTLLKVRYGASLTSALFVQSTGSAA